MINIHSDEVEKKEDTNIKDDLEGQAQRLAQELQLIELELQLINLTDD